MRSKLILILLLLASLNFYYKETIPGRSSYSFRYNILDCNNIEYLRGCRHEIGHKMDDDLGMISSTPEFNAAIAAYAIAQLDLMHNPDPVAIFIRVYPDKVPGEMYAAIYASVDGDISKLPDALQVFYSTDNQYKSLYTCLARVGRNICDGLNFSHVEGEST